MNEADRDVWNEMQRDAAPDVRVISQRQHRARKAIRLDCGCITKPGDLYCSMAWLEDGSFKTAKGHPLLACPLTIVVWGTETVQGIAP